MIVVESLERNTAHYLISVKSKRTQRYKDMKYFAYTELSNQQASLPS